jgi:hypothetical protein
VSTRRQRWITEKAQQLVANKRLTVSDISTSLYHAWARGFNEGGNFVDMRQGAARQTEQPRERGK